MEYNTQQFGNHLINQQSLYLKQHAYNPVYWYPWGKEAISRAQQEDKPIFVSIGYSSCHWCHVMEREVFENEEIANFLNQHFINIKVDREERPDLDQFYMEAVIAQTGSGGWPMSVFLTPKLKPFFGGTYFPPRIFMRLITKIIETYRESRNLVDDQADKVYQAISKEPYLSHGTISYQLFEMPLALTKNNYDYKWGGFNNQIKFPKPVTWSFLLDYYRKTGEQELGNIIRTTLDNMASGGIFDHLAGGFHRYSTEPSWLIPHFEKMLYDNALLSSLYLDAASVFDYPAYLEVAEDTLDFICDEMRSLSGGFFSSIDADSDGKEGEFYLWTTDEIRSVIGPEHAEIITDFYGVDPTGNFEGKNILTRRHSIDQLAEKHKLKTEEAKRIIELAQKKLRQVRAHRQRPRLDHKVITAWNGLTISALAKGYRLLDRPDYLHYAKRAADFLMKVHWKKNGLLRSSYDGNPENNGTLDDYAFLALGLIDLYQVSGDVNQLKRATKLIDFTLENFKHPKAGFYLTRKGTADQIIRQVEVIDGVLPSGNSALLKAIFALASLTGNQDLHSQVESNLEAYLGLLERSGLEMTGWHALALRILGPFYEVVIAGQPDNPDTQKLIEGYYKINPAHAVLSLVPASGPSKEALRLNPSLAGKKVINDLATAYVCQLGICKQPTDDPDKLANQILSGWQK
jgi:uncharacterized protein YyaL (SSP411 family)